MARKRAAATVPEEIIVEIVTRLPIKSVGRCRCVCKRWRSLFSGTKFAKSHMQSAFERRTLSRRLVLLNNLYESLDLDLGKLKMGELKKPSLKLGHPNAPFKKQGYGLCFLGSCNGLVACFTYKISLFGQDFERLFMWNPSTGFYKKITVPGEGFRLNPWPPRLSTRGFGYVSSTNDYKVVWQVEIGKIDIFSFRTLTWNSIKSPWFGFQSIGVMLREALHWLAHDYYRDVEAESVGHMDRPIFVFALDLATEEFRKIQVPSTDLDTTRGRLGVSCEGCLYIMNYRYRFCIDYVVDFWVMREYGDSSESWTKSFSLRFPWQPDHRIYSLEPIWQMETCAFVMNKPEDDMPGGDKIKMHAEADMNMVHVDKKHENDSIYILHSNILHSFPVLHKFPPDMIVYEESLNEYEEVEEGQKALISYVPQGLITLKRRGTLA